LPEQKKKHVDGKIDNKRRGYELYEYAYKCGHGKGGGGGAAMNAGNQQIEEKKEATTIAKRYDSLRASIPVIVHPNIMVLTRGIYDKFNDSEVGDILQKVKYFNDFTPDNDPYGEHDFGAFIYKGVKIFWKIDNYNGQEGYQLVLTVMLAEDY
jgi:hypothetical protein